MKRMMERILQIRELAIPKEAYDVEEIVRVFECECRQAETSWLVPCTHSTNAPATESQLVSTERELGHSIAKEYREFLRISNGAQFFVIPRRWLDAVFPGSCHVRFRLLSCSEIVNVHAQLLSTFREMYHDDPEFADVSTLNYLAFCEAENGNYQALLLDGASENKVFMLDHELLYRPYSYEDADAYYTIADSFHSWLHLIADSGGWEGRGVLTAGL